MEPFTGLRFMCYNNTCIHKYNHAHILKRKSKKLAFNFQHAVFFAFHRATRKTTYWQGESD